ncbi:CobW family GTP-binding protein [Streptomyces sp. NPDC054842]
MSQPSQPGQPSGPGQSGRPSRPSPQIPVVVLAGFLGSGKTTLLNHLLHHSGGSRIGAIVNDFGAIEIDAMAVAGALGDSTVALGNGCLCCAVDAGELDDYLERLARPSAGIDVIVIEASGLAEPQELVRMVLASENPRVVYGGLVEVVDAAEFDATRARHPEIERHLALADLVVVNKLDRTVVGRQGHTDGSNGSNGSNGANGSDGPDGSNGPDGPRSGDAPVTDGERVLRTVRELAGRAAVVPAAFGRVDPEFLFDCRPSEERIGQLSFDDLHVHAEGDPGGDGGDHGGHLHSAYESLSFTSGVPLAPRRLMDFLDSRPEGLYRIKGYVDFGPADPRNRYAVHAVGRFLRFYPEPWTGTGERLTQLVLIGAGIDTRALGKELEACKEDAPHADEHSMWGVLRYVQEQDPRE